MKKIPENVLLVIKAVSPLILIVMLFLILGNIVFVKIMQMQEAVDKAKTEQVTLIQKLDLLRTISATGVRDSNAATIALPDESPALAVTSQLKSVAAQSGLILTSLKARAGASDGSDINNVSVDFDIAGPKAEVSAFLFKTRTLAPIITISKIELTESDGMYDGKVTVNSYWSSFPTQLPSTIEGFQDLTQDDRAVLSSVSSLSPPNFIELPPTEGGGKENPFQ